MSLLEEHGLGLMIAVDEIDASEEELIRLASVYQLFVTDNRRVALIMAGLPYNVERAKKDKKISFVRRAQQRQLTRIEDFEVADAIRKTVKKGGREIEEGAVEIAVKAAEGFPFMIQLVGYRMWEESPDTLRISAEDARAGAALAGTELRTYILESTYRELSDGDVVFLEAMLRDEKDSLLKDISKRLGKSSGYVGTYKERLCRAGIIGETDRNRIGFELPGFRDYLKERLNI